MNRRQTGWLAALVLSVVAASQAAAGTLPSAAVNKHLGPATCASGVCHGKVSPDPKSNVMLNEYRTWLRRDYHSRAYTVLRSDESKAIARKLGLSSAQTADICLDCHADNVPAARRGEEFQISDGVGCEACHGGAERWIESHAEEGATHADNLARGMYPTENAEARAQLCLSCHLGTEEKFADHDIMAAGHPRMSFELTIFTDLQPPHYKVDDDYVKRKGKLDKADIWVKGVLYKARRELELAHSDLFSGHGLFPELAFFDCHACHHPMNDLRWAPSSVTRQIPIGVPRLNDGSLQMLIAISSVVAPDRGDALSSNVAQLHVASTRGYDTFVNRVGKLQRFLAELGEQLADHDYTEREIRAMRRTLLHKARGGEYRDFTSAEQAYMGVETLCIRLGEYDRWKSSLDKWFKTVEDEHAFKPGRFAAVARQFYARVR